MPELFAEIDGRHVSLNVCDWVLWGPCGCPFGVTVARYSLTEELAWKSFYDRKRDAERARRRGERMELITHQRWRDEVADRMRGRCPHGKDGDEKEGPGS
jgi:hypothetical protein